MSTGGMEGIQVLIFFFGLYLGYSRLCIPELLLEGSVQIKPGSAILRSNLPTVLLLTLRTSFFKSKLRARAIVKQVGRCVQLNQV